MRVAILCNGKDLACWQRRAVDLIARDHELFVLACGDQPAPRRRLRHLAYYALNLVTVRNRQTRRVPFPEAGFGHAGEVEVEPVIDGNWAELPEAALAWLKAQKIDAVVKFGLGLLRVPNETDFLIPILSFHHGDPRKSRGRPAGVWEIAHGEPFLGQVVQVLSNQLDAGRVIAFAETKTTAHSYRRTLVEAYSLSPYLLPVALRALANGESAAIEPAGRNYRLPGTGSVLRFVAGRLTALLRWLAYGAFIEKRWNVAAVELDPADDPIAAVRAAEQRPWDIPKLAAPFLFYADPFFDPESGGIIVEALNRWSGKGVLVRLGESAEPLGQTGGHTSYPATISDGSRHYVVPEISEWSATAGIYALEAGRLEKVADLDIADQRLIDPTLLDHDGHLYLFANLMEDGVNLLHLWTATSLFGRFERHPMSPIRLSARGSRMAGQIVRSVGGLYRFGQDARKGYGDGLLAFRITALSPSDYCEGPAGEVAFRTVNGPHTANFGNGRLLFDFYRERFSPFAGIRRAVSKL
jgi:hypothetical protein